LRERKYERDKKDVAWLKKKGVGTHGEMRGNNCHFVPLPCYERTKSKKTVLSPCKEKLFGSLCSKDWERIFCFVRHSHSLMVGH